MTSISDNELAQTETLLRERLAQLAEYAPTAVHLPGEVPVVAHRPVRQRGRRAGFIAAVTALIGAGGFTTYSFLGAGNDGGAATPEEAVTTFVSAIEQEDLIGMIDVTLPEEVGALRSSVDSITADAKRTGLLADAFDASGVKGIDISFDDLVLATNHLEGGLAAVTATSGSVNAAFDPQSFPYGEKVRELLDGSQQVTTSSVTLGTSDPPASLMTVERDGRWYVSIEYTIAEYARRAAGWEIPGPVVRTPVGFSSPEEAVTGLYDRLGALDLQAAIDTFAPGEDAIAWLAPMWMSDAQAAIDRGRGDGWSLAISGLTYETIGEGDYRTLKPATFTVEGTVPANFNSDSGDVTDPSLPTVVASVDGAEYTIVPPGQVPATVNGLTFTLGFPTVDSGYNFTFADADGRIKPLVFTAAPAPATPQPFKIERADGCTTYTGTGAQLMFGFEPNATVTEVDGGYQLCGPGDMLGGLALLWLGAGLNDLPAVSVVQQDGKWYVSPMGTLLASVVSNLHDMRDGSSLFDSPLGPIFFGGFSRTYLTSTVTGQSEASIDPSCLAALTIENGAVTGVVADPPADAIRACIDAMWSEYPFVDSSSGTAVEAPPKLGTP